MPGVTNSQGLIYPTGTDRRCDFPEQWGDMADLLQQRINAIQGINNRTYPTVPAALLHKTEAQTFNNTVTFSNPISFDQVVLDTDNMTNLSANTTIIVPQRSGFYQATAYCEVAGTTGDATNWHQMSINGLGSGVVSTFGNTVTASIGDDGDAWEKQLSCSGFISWDLDTGTPSSISCEVTYGGGGAGTGQIIRFVSLGLYWWSDLP